MANPLPTHLAQACEIPQCGADSPHVAAAITNNVSARSMSLRKSLDRDVGIAPSPFRLACSYTAASANEAGLAWPNTVDGLENRPVGCTDAQMHKAAAMPRKSFRMR